MKALIWKECREIWIWAALGLVIGALVWASQVRKLPWPGSLVEVQPVPAMCMLALAAGLGALQAGNDNRVGRRALLLHRPLDRSHIFLTKAAAGLGLYVLAASIPFAGAIYWIATPGHVAAPFRWAMALPGIADILTGAVFYFAALLTAQRSARSCGNFGLALAAALAAWVLVVTVYEFWQALLVIAVASAVVGAAAWGSFLSGGADAGQPTAARAGLAVTILIGLLIAGGVGVALTHELFATRRYTSQLLDRHGEVLSLRYEGQQLQSVTDTTGRQRDIGAVSHDLFSASELRAATVYLLTRGTGSTYRGGGGRFYTFMQNNDPRAPTLWLYVFDEGRVHGYDSVTRRFIGSIGPDGFRSAGQPPGARFEGELLWHMSWPNDYLAFADAVYKVDMAKPGIRKVYTPPPGDPILRVARWHPEGKGQPLAFVLTQRAMRVVDETSGRDVFAAPHAVSLDDHFIEATRLEDPVRYVFWYRSLQTCSADSPGLLLEYDATGRETARRPVPPLEQEAPWDITGYALVTPAVVAAAIVGLYTFVWGQCLGTQPELIALYAGLMLLSAGVCAAGCWALARRYALSGAARLGWTLTGFGFGPAGLLLLLSIQERPARVACPGCRQPRVVDRTYCEHCSAPHASPPRDGTEIFEAAHSAASGAVH